MTQYSPRRKGLLIVLMVALCCLGTVVGVAVRSLWPGRPTVVLDPSQVILTRDPLEGEVVKVNLVLRNYSNTDCAVMQSFGSCGCLTIGPKGGVPLPRDAVLRAQSAMPWEVTIETKGYAGKNRFRVGVMCVNAGKKILASSEITLRVRPGIRVDPTILQFNDVDVGSSAVLEFVVLDALPDPGTEIVECFSRAPDRLSVHLERVANDERRFLGDARVKVRYRVAVTFRATESGRLFEDAIVLVAKDTGTGRRITEMPVISKTSKPAYRLMPPSLFLVATAPGKEYRREVRCMLRKGVAESLRVLKSPDFVHVAIREVGVGIKVIDVRCLMPQSEKPPSQFEIVFSAGAEDVPVCTLPVRLVSTEHTIPVKSPSQAK